MDEEGSLYQGGWNRDRNVLWILVSTMEEQVGEYYLKTWNVKRDVWLSVCRKGSAIERCLPEKIALEQVLFIRDRSADHNENGTGSVPIEMENGGWDSCMTS